MNSQTVVFFICIISIIWFSSCNKQPLVIQEHILTPMYDKQVSIDSLLLKTKIAVDTVPSYSKDSLRSYGLKVR